MEPTTEKGQRAHTATRRALSNKIADGVTGKEDAIAVFTKHGEHAGERMWLVKPMGKAWVVGAGGMHCAITKEKFDAGERVIQGQYYTR